MTFFLRLLQEIEPGTSFCLGIFPGRGNVAWRDWYTHNVVESTPGQPTTLSAPLGHINVHIRDGAAILLHAQPAYTIEETRQGPYSLLVSQTAQGIAHGSAYIDDGISYPPGLNRILEFSTTKNEVVISSTGTFHVEQKLQDVTVLGVSSKPKSVTVNGRSVQGWTYTAQQDKLVVANVGVDLNQPLSVKWS